MDLASSSWAALGAARADAYSAACRRRSADVRRVPDRRAAPAAQPGHGAEAAQMSQGRIRVLVVDNYDSFVYNLVQYLGQLGVDVVVHRNDEVSPADLDALGVDGVLLSPGPGTPADAGATTSFVSACADRLLPLFGVCLGHQAIGEVFGAPVVRAPELLHGKTSEVFHD